VNRLVEDVSQVIVQHVIEILGKGADENEMRFKLVPQRVEFISRRDDDKPFQMVFGHDAPGLLHQLLDRDLGARRPTRCIPAI